MFFFSPHLDRYSEKCRARSSELFCHVKSTITLALARTLLSWACEVPFTPSLCRAQRDWRGRDVRSSVMELPKTSHSGAPRNTTLCKLKDRRKLCQASFQRWIQSHWTFKEGRTSIGADDPPYSADQRHGKQVRFADAARAAKAIVTRSEKSSNSRYRRALFSKRRMTAHKFGPTGRE
jgi:hypothetical protein